MKVLEKNCKALKEWAVVVDALAQGRQTLIFRKGGIDEGVGGFEVEEREFFLFPTYEHQNKEELISEVHPRLDEIKSLQPGDGKIHVAYYGSVQSIFKITNLQLLLQLEGRHVWSRSVIEERFNWGKGMFLFTLILRVFKLQNPFAILNRPEFGGCKSWVNFEENISTEGVPVLSNPEFHRQKSEIEKILKHE